MVNPRATPGPKTIPKTVAELMDIIWEIAARNRAGPIGVNDATTLRNIAPMVQPVLLESMAQIKEAFGVPIAERVQKETDKGIAEADREFEDPLLQPLTAVPRARSSPSNPDKAMSPIPCVSLTPSHEARGDLLSQIHNKPKQKAQKSSWVLTLDDPKDKEDK